MGSLGYRQGYLNGRPGDALRRTTSWRARAAVTVACSRP